MLNYLGAHRKCLFYARVRHHVEIALSVASFFVLQLSFWQHVQAIRKLDDLVRADRELAGFGSARLPDDADNISATDRLRDLFEFLAFV